MPNTRPPIRSIAVLHAKGVSDPLCGSDSHLMGTIEEVTCARCLAMMPKIRWATVEDVQRTAQELSVVRVQCRIYGHAWKPFTVTTSTTRRNVYDVRQQCGRGCGCMRHQEILATTGEAKSGWNIEYGEGYLIKIGRIGKHGRNVLRLAALRTETIREIDDEVG